jgi:hypothetical protein
MYVVDIADWERIGGKPTENSSKIFGPRPAWWRSVAFAPEILVEVEADAYIDA